MLLALARPVSAEPTVLIFGGGWGAEGTQQSIESHVEALESALAEQKPRILFAAGPGPTRAVQEIAAERNATSDLLGLVFDHAEHLGVLYRPARVKAASAASKASLLAELTRASTSKEGAIVFGAGHGSPAANGERAGLELWGPDDRVTVAALAAHLDDAAAKGPFTFVLGQCHSGAFTSIAHVAGDESKPLASPTRCVLAAVPADREAAGCTADLTDPSARSYLALIAEALGTKSADKNGDGRVALDEAHAHARLHDQTVDVPVSSSELWLERRLPKVGAKLEQVDLQKLLKSARPLERAVVQGLLSDAERLAPHLARREALDRELAVIDRELDELLEVRERARRVVLDAVLARWPELANPYHTESRRLLAGDAAEVVKLIEAQPELAKLRSVETKGEALHARAHELEKAIARSERLFRAVRGAAREAALRAKGKKHEVAALDALLACESRAPSK